MKKISEVMKFHNEFCNLETRVPEILFIMRKYDFKEVVIVDFNDFPVGIVYDKDVSDESMKNIIHPYDVKAKDIMKRMAVSIKKDQTIEECLEVMENNHLEAIPVVDEFGHSLGLIKKMDIFPEIENKLEYIY